MPRTFNRSSLLGPGLSRRDVVNLRVSVSSTSPDDRVSVSTATHILLRGRVTVTDSSRPVASIQVTWAAGAASSPATRMRVITSRLDASSTA